jgi:multiple sugar transport system ATP-binding protein
VADAVTAAADTSDDADSRLLADDRARFIAILDGRARLRPGDAVTLRVDPTQLHAFDSATGESLLAAAAPAPQAA